MAAPTPERDWKYMKRVKPDLLSALCQQINAKTSVILADGASSAHERYLKVYRHIQGADDVVAECFNDWRRSTLMMRLFSLRKHGLLTDEYLEGLSETAQGTVRAIVDGDA